MKRLHFASLAAAALLLSACSTPDPQPVAANSGPTASPSAAAVSTAEMEKTIIALEKKSWELWRSKNLEEGKKLEAPGSQSIYFGAVKSDQESDKDINNLEYTDLTFSDWKVTLPVPGTAIVTYKGVGKSTYKGKDNSGTFLASSVWVNISGEWKSALYHETKIEPQPKK